MWGLYFLIYAARYWCFAPFSFVMGMTGAGVACVGRNSGGLVCGVGAVPGWCLVSGGGAALLMRGRLGVGTGRRGP